MKVLAWPAFKTRYLNPYNWLLYQPMAQQGVEVEEFSFKRLLSKRYDIFHLHWAAETIVRHPSSIMAWVRARMMLALIDWAKFRGTRIVWTFHDKIPHIVLHPKVAEWFQGQLLKRIDGYISMCQIGKELAQECYPSLRERPCGIIPHGHYRGEYADECDRATARNQLNIPQTSNVILFLGYIAPYKNIPLLIQTFRELNDPDAILLIVGRLDLPEMQGELEKSAHQDSRIRLLFGYVPNEELQFYYRAADLVVLPFAEILNSGSALLALSFDCPILVPNQGAMAELQTWVGYDWVKVYENELNANLLKESLEWIQKPRSQQAPLEQLDWKQLSFDTIKFYQSLCSKSI
ncbi:glycosyltransferase family 4 protein [Roseofilum capinflatum]|uniref:Glycosyltransferase family 4 protein n=1 Tax=Roseofilum capinflatum BLCC-M114 TaxID=3022440 RepID=A0ABT7B8Z9_9CYAN|nr:glycosyltransferase family 4 protein [Roseofilum capinflatum]MDJ1174981.1 glycosyltransferase family 4 protein [Roseofilum capinflatum BLCC-M114]